MSWWRSWRRRRFRPYSGDELSDLEEYRAELKEEIEELREELRELGEELTKRRQERLQPSLQPGFRGYGWSMGSGQGWSMGGRGFGRRGGRWGRRMGMRGGWGMGWQQPAAPPFSPPALSTRTSAKIAVPVDDSRGLESRVSQLFARSRFMALIDLQEGEVRDIRIVENPSAPAPQGAGFMVADWLLNQRVDTVLAPSLGPNIMQVLGRSGIAVYPVRPGVRISEALRELGFIR